jgi:O-Antigen ligase
MAVSERRYSLERSLIAARSVAAANPALAPVLLSVVVFVALAASDGGFYATAWYAAALFLLGLLAVTAVVLGRPGGVPRATLVALGLFAAYTLWTYCSIAWADQQGPAWDGANRTLTYLLVFALFALWPAERRGATLAIGCLGIGVAGLGLVQLLLANGAESPGQFFVAARLAEPAGYINANVALWTIGMFACVFTATRRELPVLLRGLGLAGAGLMGPLALMGQSRGWALALPLAVLLYLVLVPGRIRSLLAFAAVGIGTFAVSGPVLDIHDEFEPGRLDGLVADATGPILVMLGALFAVGVVAALADRRVDPAGRGVQGLSRAAAGAAALVAIAALVALATADPIDRASDAWNDFKSNEEQPIAGASRFSTAGTNRYDFWTVAWDVFQDHPVRGIGVENYQVEYLLRGESTEQPRYAHSLELGVLSQTGIVGALLLGGALLAAIWAGVLALRRLPGAPERACAGAALAVFGYWLLHASVDWLWEFPAVTAPAIAMLGLAGALAPRPEPAERPEARPAQRSRLAIVLAVVPLALVVSASFALPWIAERQVSKAAEVWRADPEAAFEHLDRAERLNPLATTAPLTEATIALRLGRAEHAESALRDALERERANSYALFELGLIAAARGERQEATRLLAETLRHSPRDVVVRDALADVRAGRRIRLDRINHAIVTRARYVASRAE